MWQENLTFALIWLPSWASCFGSLFFSSVTPRLFFPLFLSSLSPSFLSLTVIPTVLSRLMPHQLSVSPHFLRTNHNPLQTPSILKQFESQNSKKNKNGGVVFPLDPQGFPCCYYILTINSTYLQKQQKYKTIIHFIIISLEPSIYINVVPGPNHNSHSLAACSHSQHNLPHPGTCGSVEMPSQVPELASPPLQVS